MGRLIGPAAIAWRRLVLGRQHDDLPGGPVGFHVAMGVGDVAHRKDAVEVRLVASVLDRPDDLLEDAPVAVAIDDAAAEAPQPCAETLRLGFSGLGVPIPLEVARDACVSSRR